MTCSSQRLPSNQDYEANLKFLLWNQFPALLDSSIKYFASLPKVGTYKHVNPTPRSFKDALLAQNSRQITMSGIGSLIDYHTYGNQIKAPRPQYSGTSCQGSSLCVDTTCFSLTEGVVESNNLMQSLCWELKLGCLKDIYYSDAKFDDKMRQYFAMFFQQAPAVLEAYLRTRLMMESIKVVCTSKNVRYTGPVFGGTNNISLPFYFNPADPTAFPDLDALTALNGTTVGGANLQAFANFVAPRLFSGSFKSGMEEVTVYGQKPDFVVAREQTASVLDKYVEMEMLRMMSMRNGIYGEGMMDSVYGNFIHDGLFPTFKSGTGNVLEPITAEILEPSTIAGYIQTSNPDHSMAQYRALLFVPSNWMFDLVEPPIDDFSYLGMGGGLNFRMNTPGVFPIMSSSMFARNTLGPDGTMILGNEVNSDGMLVPSARGLVQRDRVLREVIRTQLIQTYSSMSCNDALAGQIPQAGRALTPQGYADGFALKSTLHIASDVVGAAKPVLLLFKVDTPRSALPIEVCDVEEITVDQTGGCSLVSCCPGNQIYAVLTFSCDMSRDFAQGNTAVYRSGASGTTYLVTVTAVSGNVVTIQSVDGQTLLPCCTGSKDDYGVAGELINTTAITATSAVVRGVLCTEGTPDVLAVELFTPVAPSLLGAGATITLCNGQVIDLVTSANASGVFVSVSPAQGETCDLCALGCECFINSTFALDAGPQ